MNERTMKWWLRVVMIMIEVSLSLCLDCLSRDRGSCFHLSCLARSIAYHVLVISARVMG